MPLFSWNLEPDPPPTPANSSTSSSGGGVTTTAAQPSLLGHGLLWPLRRDLKNDFANDSGVQLIRSCVAQVLGVRASSDDGLVQGELPWRPEFGSKLYLLKHKRGRMLTAFADVYVREALQRWEPRVVVTAVSAEWDNTGRTLTIFLRYNVLAKNTPGSVVLFRDVSQDLSLPIAA
jgi:uncharacterized protein